MLRWIAHIVALLSLMLCVALGVLWVRSYWYRDWLSYHSIRVNSHWGSIMWNWESPSPDQRFSFASEREIPVFHRRGSLMFGSFNVFIPPSTRLRVVVFPLWVPLLLTAIAPVLWWRYFRHLRRHPPGHCPACGYDLRGSPGPACPECGAASAAPAAK